MRHYDYSDLVVPNEWEQDSLPLVVPRRYEAEVDFPNASDSFDWQVTYKFPSTRRRNKFVSGTYGGKNMTFRRLYTLLVRLNGGVSFIDDYMANVLPYSEAGADLDNYLSEIREKADAEFSEMYDAAPKRKRDGGVYKRWLPKLYALKAATDSSVKEHGAVVAQRIKDDLVGALRDGRVPLSPNLVSARTAERRIKAGLNPEPRYYASGQFINSIQVYCRLGRKGEWAQDIMA